MKRDGKTLCPTGFRLIFEELKDAVNYYGYKVNGYIFERGQVFNDYVNHFYNVKMNSTGSDRNIAKLMLNSLYGKFGMNPIMERIEILDTEKAIEEYLNSEVSDILDLGNNLQ